MVFFSPDWKSPHQHFKFCSKHTKNTEICCLAKSPWVCFFIGYTYTNISLLACSECTTADPTTGIDQTWFALAFLPKMSGTERIPMAEPTNVRSIALYKHASADSTPLSVMEMEFFTGKITENRYSSFNLCSKLHDRKISKLRFSHLFWLSATQSGPPILD